MNDNTDDRPESGDTGHDEATDQIDHSAADTGPVNPQHTPLPPTDQVPPAPQTRHHTRQFSAEDRAAQQEPSEFLPIPPATGQTAAQPAVKKTSKFRSGGTGRTVALVSVATLLLVLIGGVGTELYLRHRVTTCLENAFGGLTGVDTDVSMPRKLMLQNWMSGDVPWVQVDTNDSGQAAHMRLHTRAENVSTDGKSVQRLSGEAFVPYDHIQTLAAQNQDGPTVDKVTGNAGEGTLTIDSDYTVLIVDVPATVEVKPVLKNGKVTFDVVKASAVGISLPNDFAQGIVDQVSEGMLGPLFEEIQVDSMKVTDQGIQFTFQGDDVNLQAAAQLTGTDTKC